MASAAL